MTEQQTRTRNVLVENLLTFDRTFGDHKISVLAGYTYQDSRYRYMQGSGQGMPTGIKEIDAAAQGLAVSGNSSRRRVDFNLRSCVLFLQESLFVDGDYPS